MENSLDLSNFGSCGPTHPTCPMGSAGPSGHNSLQPGKPFGDCYLSCPASRLLAKWVLLPKMPFPHLIFYFEIRDSQVDEKIAQRSPLPPSTSFPDGDRSPSITGVNRPNQEADVCTAQLSHQFLLHLLFSVSVSRIVCRPPLYAQPSVSAPLTAVTPSLGSGLCLPPLTPSSWRQCSPGMETLQTWT